MSYYDVEIVKCSRCSTEYYIRVNSHKICTNCCETIPSAKDEKDKFIKLFKETIAEEKPKWHKEYKSSIIELLAYIGFFVMWIFDLIGILMWCVWALIYLPPRYLYLWKKRKRLIREKQLKNKK